MALPLLLSFLGGGLAKAGALGAGVLGAAGQVGTVTASMT
jgi:hypothetical protein